MLRFSLCMYFFVPCVVLPPREILRFPSPQQVSQVTMFHSEVIHVCIILRRHWFARVEERLKLGLTTLISRGKVCRIFPTRIRRCPPSCKPLERRVRFMGNIRYVYTQSTTWRYHIMLELTERSDLEVVQLGRRKTLVFGYHGVMSGEYMYI